MIFLQPMRCIRRLILLTVITASMFIFLFVFSANISVPQIHDENDSRSYDLEVFKDNLKFSSGAIKEGTQERIVSSRDLVPFDLAVIPENRYNITGQDAFVLLHIQKTGGTAFERHLVYDLKIPVPCICNNERRRCSCPRPIMQSIEKRHPKQGAQPKTISDYTWLISRFSIGWACGLHPDFTQLRKCLYGLKKLYFLTFLRHPLDRFISEFRHVKRGATWKASKSHCRNYDTQICYGRKTHWSNVTLEDFMNCSSNMAINRQTKMLASYDNFLCDNSHIENNILLASAMSNLDQMSFFGICEQQRASQILFEQIFGMKFSSRFKQSADNETRSFIARLPEEVKSKILKLNNLDLKLYNYAVDLFAYRCNQLTNSDDCGAKI